MSKGLRLLPSLGDACLDTTKMEDWTVTEAAWYSYWWLNADHTEREIPRPSSPGSLLLQTCGDELCVHPGHLKLIEPRNN